MFLSLFNDKLKAQYIINVSIFIFRFKHQPKNYEKSFTQVRQQKNKEEYDPRDFDFDLGDEINLKDKSLLSTLILSKKEYKSSTVNNFTNNKTNINSYDGNYTKQRENNNQKSYNKTYHNKPEYPMNERYQFFKSHQGNRILDTNYRNSSTITQDPIFFSKSQPKPYFHDERSNDQHNNLQYTNNSNRYERFNNQGVIL